MSDRPWQRGLGLALLVVAAILHLALTRPLSQRLDRALEQHARLRRDRAALEADARATARAERARADALRAFAAAAGPGEELPRTRRAALDLLAGSGLRRVRLSVRPGTSSSKPAVQLQASGPFLAARRWLDRLVEPGSGLVVENLRLRGEGADVTLDLAASRVELAAP